MTAAELRDIIKRETEESFSGWDFSHIEGTGRSREFPLAWNYRSEIYRSLPAASSLLDLGTGGGEFLASLSPLPQRTCATEGYAPNLPIARNRLGPRGVELREIGADEIIPFEDSAFDLVLNRHESYTVEEVRRVLKQGAAFITQQVGGMNGADLNMSLGYPNYSFADWCLAKAVGELESGGFSIEKAKESLGKTRFFDIGAIIYYLKCIPWQIEGFDPEQCFDRLEALERRIEDEGYFDFICHRFLIVARRAEPRNSKAE
jgi:Methyltransferase domain.